MQISIPEIMWKEISHLFVEKKEKEDRVRIRRGN
jgi:hypothetical protein